MYTYYQWKNAVGPIPEDRHLEPKSRSDNIQFVIMGSAR
jgi:hypothetical protein